MDFWVVGLALFTGTVLHATIGFGSALIVMPVLALVIGLKTAVPVVALSGMVMTSSVLIIGWRDVDFVSVRGMLLGIMAVPSQYLAGHITRQVLVLAAASVPITLSGLWVGTRLHRHVTPGRYDQAVRVLLVLMGLGMIGKGADGILP